MHIPRTQSMWIGHSGRDWVSRENCTVTQYGAQKVCSNYRLEGLIWREKALNVKIANM